MFTVNLYQFSKKENSTKRPSGNGLSFSSCVLKSGCSIVSPVIEFNIGNTTNPERYNYAYISEFNRYYFIEDWYYERGIWNATMRCDVLATYKTEIGNFNGYVLRCASAYDGDIIDALYPTKAISTYSNVSITSPWVSNLTDGCFILGVVSRNGNFGSMNYYIMERSALVGMLTQLISDSFLEDNHFSKDDATIALQKSIVDPLQFIKTAYYIPLAYSDFASTAFPIVHPVIFDWELPSSVNGRKVSNTATPYITKTFTVNLPKHPQASSRGNYMNTDPYTDYQLSIPPFNAFSLSADNLINVSSITITIRIDLIEGNGQLEVYNGSNLIQRVESKVFVPIQLSQVYYDAFGSATSLISGAGSIAGGILSGNAGAILGGVAGMASGFMQAKKPIASNVGGNGSFIDLVYPCKLYARFQTAVQDDNTNHGRPLMQMRTLNTLSGYILVQDGDISLDSTQSESQQVKAYLEGGFYYE